MAKFKRPRKVFVYALIAAGILLIVAERKSIATIGAKLMNEAQKAIFATVIPSNAKPYSDIILQVAAEQGVNPFYVVALGDRETHWGAGPGLDVTGPTGTGDFTARTGSWTTISGVTLYQNASDLPSGWRAAKNSSGPYAIPADGRGWGRGLMQLDYQLALTVDWSDAYTNISTGALTLKKKLAYIASKLPSLSTSDLVAAALAAYNAGEGRVVRAIQNGQSVDSLTTGGNYSSDVLAKIAAYTSAFTAAGGGAIV